MTTLVLDPELSQDIERIAKHLQTHEAEGIAERIGEILEALWILERHPRIGRPVAQGRRELVIGRDSRGYVARYRYDEPADVVIVFGLKSQLEAGFVDR